MRFELFVYFLVQPFFFFVFCLAEYLRIYIAWERAIGDAGVTFG
jgi:hypothetical protein